jgi:integrase
LEDVSPVRVEGGETVVTKRKSLQYPFCKYVVEWREEALKLSPPEDAYLFPPYKTVAGFIWKSHLTVQRLDQILQRLDPTLTSHMFRYGHSEKLLQLGYTPYEVKEIGDWASTRMPEVYAERKGLTKSQKQYAEDVRMI